jgi:outer membrane immunogenic protein
MSMRNFGLAMAAMALLSAGHAYAADAVVEQPVVATTYDWSGFYVLGEGGYGWGNSDHEHLNVNTFGGPGGTYSNDGNGFVGGVAVGYNVAFTNGFVVGIEAALRSGQKLDDGGEFEIYNNSTTTKSKYVASVAGRAGYAFGSFLPYVKAGWAGADVESTQNYHPGGTPTTWSDSKFMNGYVVGAGLDYAVTDNIFVGVEYAYMNFGKKTFNGLDSNGTLTQISGNLREQSVMARIGMKF